MFADLWIRKFTTIKMVFLSKLIYKFNAIQIITPAVIFIETDKLILKAKCKYEEPRILKKKNKVEGLL